MMSYPDFQNVGGFFKKKSQTFITLTKFLGNQLTTRKNAFCHVSL